MNSTRGRVVPGAAVALALALAVLAGACSGGGHKAASAVNADGGSTTSTAAAADGATTTSAAAASTTTAAKAQATPTTAARAAATTSTTRPPTTMATTATTAATTATTAAPGGSAALTIQGYSFMPAVLNVKAGTKVTVTNQDPVGHTWTSDNGAWDSGTLGQGSTSSHTFTTPGTYTYHCSIHSSMKGTVNVS